MTSSHVLLVTSWLLCQRAARVAPQTVCPRDEARCEVDLDTDATRVFLMQCSGYGSVPQLPPACNDTRVISTVIISQATHVDTLQPRILDGLRIRQLELVGLGIRSRQWSIADFAPSATF